MFQENNEFEILFFIDDPVLFETIKQEIPFFTSKHTEPFSFKQRRVYLDSPELDLKTHHYSLAMRTFSKGEAGFFLKSKVREIEPGLVFKKEITFRNLDFKQEMVFQELTPFLPEKLRNQTDLLLPLVMIDSERSQFLAIESEPFVYISFDRLRFTDLRKRRVSHEYHMIEIETSGIPPENVSESKIVSVIQHCKNRYGLKSIYPCKYTFSTAWLSSSSGSPQ